VKHSIPAYCIKSLNSKNATLGIKIIGSDASTNALFIGPAGFCAQRVISVYRIS